MSKTIKIKSIVPVSEKSSVKLGENDQWKILNQQMIVYETVEDESKEEKEDVDTDTENAERDFRAYWQIRPGVHMLHQNEGMIPIPQKEEKYFETSTSKKILKYLNNFYDKIDVLEKYKKKKRSYLLHSEPGMGKSALIRHLCRQALQKEGAAVLYAPGDINFNILNHIFMKDYHEDVKFIVLIIEDMGRKDYAANMNYFNSSCLSFLDGQEALFRVPTLVIATTNFPKELGPQLTNRPGRFNKIIKVDLPSDEEKFELIEGYTGEPLTSEQKEGLAGKELTPDHCIEAVIRSEIEEMPLTQAVEEILKERQGLMEWKK